MIAQSREQRKNITVFKKEICSMYRMINRIDR